MLKHDRIIMNSSVKLVLQSTEDHPYLVNFIHIWVDGNVLFIKMKKLGSVEWANYILKSFYEEGLLEEQYILRIEDSDHVSLIRQKDDLSIGYQAGELIKLYLDNYEMPEPALTSEVPEPELTFESLLDVC